MEGTIIEFDGEHYHLDEMTTEEIVDLVDRYKDFEEFEGEIILARRFLLYRIFRKKYKKKREK